MEELRTEFLINLFYNDKFIKYIKLIEKNCICPEDPQYAEFHKFISLLSDMATSVDDEYDD